MSDTTAFEWSTLDELPCGSVFETRDGIRAVKSEYCYSNRGKIECVLLESGEYAHFSDDPREHNATEVRVLTAVRVPTEEQAVKVALDECARHPMNMPEEELIVCVVRAVMKSIKESC